MEGIRQRVTDDRIQIVEIMLVSRAESLIDTELYRLLETTTRKHKPDAIVVPAVSTGFTDGHFFRDLGIASYGYAPSFIPREALVSVHGNNERIGIETFNRGVQIMADIIAKFVTGGGPQQ